MTVGIDHRVLNDRAVLEIVGLVHDGPVDLGLLAGVDVDHLGIAAVFEVGDAVVAPAVLVVPQQGAFGIGRKRGLAGARKPQQQGHVTVRPLVGGTVQGEDADCRQHEIHDREHQFLDAAAIGGAVDNADPLVEIHDHRHIRGPAVRQVPQALPVANPVKLVVGQNQQGEFLVGKQAAPDIFRHRAKHVVGKKRGQGPVADHTNRQGVGGIGPQDPVGDIQPVLARQTLQGVGKKHLEGLFRNRDVVG